MSKLKKKVIFIIDTLQGAGAERSLVQIAKHFTSYEPVFIHLYKGSFLKSDLEMAGISVYSLDIEKQYGFKEAVTKLIPIYEKEEPDLIHSTLYRADMVARRMKKKFPNIPLIGSFVNNSYTPVRYQNQSFIMKFKLWLAYLVDKRTSKLVDFFISNSETIKKAEGSALNVPPERIKVIYRGRDFSAYNTAEDSTLQTIEKELNLKNKNVLINVSRLIYRKAQLDIINAMPAVLKKFPDTILLIAGHGDYQTLLENRIAELKLQKHVRLLGSRTDIPELLNVSDIFVYPSYAEGLPGALIEAMMTGKLIIASDIGENLECVNKESALIFKKADVDELGEKIIYGLQNYEDLNTLRDNARLQAKQKFEIRTIADKYEDVYDMVKSETVL